MADPAQSLDSFANLIEVDLEDICSHVEFRLPHNLTFSDVLQRSGYSGHSKCLHLEPRVRAEVACNRVRTHAEPAECDDGKRNLSDLDQSGSHLADTTGPVVPCFTPIRRCEKRNPLLREGGVDAT